MAKEDIASIFARKGHRRPWDELADDGNSKLTFQSIGDLAINAVLQANYQLNASQFEKNSEVKETVDKVVDTLGKGS